MEPAFQELARQAVEAGWQETEVAAALKGLAEANIAALGEPDAD